MTNQATLPADTFCNPLPVPNYPTGICAPSRRGQEAYSDNYFIGPCRDYRELADPEGLYIDGKWYVFPSARQAYVSSDLAHWEHCPLIFEEGSPDLGYAPSLAKLGDRYLLTSSTLYRGVSSIFIAPAPLGPYRSLGAPVMPDGSPIEPEWLDPTIFVDDDGRLYMYWHFGGAGVGIYGAEFDVNNPVQAITEPVKLIDFDPNNEFERYGDCNESPDLSYVEGEAMFKHNGEYYFQYAANGTVFRRYVVGVYRGAGPLGPFKVQRTPVTLSPHGRVSGTGHGSWMAGPDGTVWQFYTCCARRVHLFERRIGVDKVLFDANGDAHVQVTDAPQSMTQGDLGLKAVSLSKPVTASSSAMTNYPFFVTDDCTHTWWMPEAADTTPWLEVDLKQEFDLEAVQIIWAEEGLDFSAGILPRAMGFKLDFYNDKRESVGTLDCTDNAVDHLVEFRTFAKVKAHFVRLSYTNPAESKIKYGVTNFTLFGKREI